MKYNRILMFQECMSCQKSDGSAHNIPRVPENLFGFGFVWSLKEKFSLSSIRTIRPPIGPELECLLFYLCKCSSFTQKRLWIGLVVSIVAFGPEGWRFESTKGYIPD